MERHHKKLQEIKMKNQKISIYVKIHLPRDHPNKTQNARPQKPHSILKPNMTSRLKTDLQKQLNIKIRHPTVRSKKKNEIDDTYHEETEVEAVYTDISDLELTSDDTDL